MKRMSLVLAASLIAALGVIGTAQAVLFSGNTNTSSPTAIDSFLTYTSTSFSNRGLEQIRAAKAAGVAIGIVLADAGYGNETAWREGLSEMELEYCVGVQSSTTVWAAGTGPVPPKRKNKIGRPPTRWRRVVGATPVRVKEWPKP